VETKEEQMARIDEMIRRAMEELHGK